MNANQYPVSPYHADLNRKDLRRMFKVVRLLNQLGENGVYRKYLESQLPPTARFDPGNHSVMMGYDFHLAATGPKLIEVNTNAGGIWYASLSYNPDAVEFPRRLGHKLLKSFLDDYALFRKVPCARPACIVILDEHPQTQPLYPEMQVFEALFRKAGIDTMIADPASIIADDAGLHINGRRIDMIYNRHCDFYLTSKTMEPIRDAWMKARVCLSPNPHTYGLLADKRRMILWSRPELMKSFGLNIRDLAILTESIPETRLLASLSPEEVWRSRKQWVFKPDTGYASRGVYVGGKLTRTKFATFEPGNMLIQREIQPSITHGAAGEIFKTDYRLFAYRDRVFGLSTRIYQGQVTNLRTEKGGFAKVRLVG